MNEILEDLDQLKAWWEIYITRNQSHPFIDLSNAEMFCEDLDTIIKKYKEL